MAKSFRNRPKCAAGKWSYLKVVSILTSQQSGCQNQTSAHLSPAPGEIGENSTRGVCLQTAAGPSLCPKTAAFVV